MGRNKLVMPFVKWVGGKRQLLGALEELLPAELVNVYRVVRDCVDELINTPNVIWRV